MRCNHTYVASRWENLKMLAAVLSEITLTHTHTSHTPMATLLTAKQCTHQKWGFLTCCSNSSRLKSDRLLGASTSSCVHRLPLAQVMLMKDCPVQAYSGQPNRPGAAHPAQAPLGADPPGLYLGSTPGLPFLLCGPLWPRVIALLPLLQCPAAVACC